MGNKNLTIIIPTYNEDHSIYDNIGLINNYLKSENIHPNFIIIDDGSSDKTWEEIKRLQSSEIPIKALKLSRNFGKESAISAGLDHVTADLCLIMDSDLQHPPELIPKMLKLKEDQDLNIVEGIKTHRGSESFIYNKAVLIFYLVLRKISGFELTNSSDFKLLDLKVINSWKSLQEKNTFFRGLTCWLGFKRGSINFEVNERISGESKWSINKLFKLASNALTSFSSAPLHIVTITGFIFFFLALILGTQTIYNKLSGIAVTGFTTVILLQLIIGSAIMISLGIIGSYLAKVFDEVKARPRYIISEEI